MSLSATAQEFEVQLPSGRFSAKRYGSGEGPLVIGVPGLSANKTGFDFLGERLAPMGMNLVSVDLRGRGKSDVTPPGTYNWLNHATDVLDLASALGAERFGILGQSMGAGVAMVVAARAPERLQRAVLLDVCGRVDDTAGKLLLASVSRLGLVYASAEEFIARVKGLGMIDPWSEYWDRYFGYDLVPVEGGVTTRSNREAVLEDNWFGLGTMAFGAESGVYSLWRHLTMPVLLLRAKRPMLPGVGGMIIIDEDVERFRREVPTATVVEVDANHYTICTSEHSCREIARFFGHA